MSDIADFTQAGLAAPKASASGPAYHLVETYWGYIVRSQSRPRIGIIAAQVVAMFMGATCLVAAIGLWVMPSAIVGEMDILFRAVASILCGGAACLLLWFSSRGTESELQIDTHQGEVREVIRNRTGRSTLMGRYGFDAVGGVYLDRPTAKGEATLVLRYRDTAQTLYVATGGRDALEPLRDRLGRDLMLAH